MSSAVSSSYFRPLGVISIVAAVDAGADVAPGPRHEAFFDKPSAGFQYGNPRLFQIHGVENLLSLALR